MIFVDRCRPNAASSLIRRPARLGCNELYQPERGSARSSLGTATRSAADPEHRPAGWCDRISQLTQPIQQPTGDRRSQHIGEGCRSGPNPSDCGDKGANLIRSTTFSLSTTTIRPPNWNSGILWLARSCWKGPAVNHRGGHSNTMPAVVRRVVTSSWPPPDWKAKPGRECNGLEICWCKQPVAGQIFPAWVSTNGRWSTADRRSGTNRQPD